MFGVMHSHPEALWAVAACTAEMETHTPQITEMTVMFDFQCSAEPNGGTM